MCFIYFQQIVNMASVAVVAASAPTVVAASAPAVVAAGVGAGSVAASAGNAAMALLGPIGAGIGIIASIFAIDDEFDDSEWIDSVPEWCNAEGHQDRLATPACRFVKYGVDIPDPNAVPEPEPESKWTTILLVLIFILVLIMAIVAGMHFIKRRRKNKTHNID